MKLKNFLLIVALMFSSSLFAETLIVKPKSMFTIMSYTYKAQPGIYVVEGDYNKLLSSGKFEYVEKNITYKALGVKSFTGTAWGIEKIKAQNAWAKNLKGKGIKVAVIDTGVDPTHKELEDRVLIGYNAIEDNNNSLDDHGHGTHCSGSIAGLSVGVAPEALILPVKFLDKNGSGTLADAIKAIEFARDQNVQIMSNSWGGGGYSKALEDVIKTATDKGIIFVAAAGNSSENNDVEQNYPANYPEVISVAATDIDDKLARFSNYGKKSVIIAAPGVNIYSSIPGGYDTYSGTSMATPHVAGALAIMLQDGCSNAKQCLKDNHKKLSSISNKVDLGRLEFQ